MWENRQMDMDSSLAKLPGFIHNIPKINEDTKTIPSRLTTLAKIHIIKVWSGIKQVAGSRRERGSCCLVAKSCQLFCNPTDSSPARLCSWDSSGKNTEVGSHSLLQGIFLTQGSNPRLLHWQADSLPLSPELNKNILWSYWIRWWQCHPQELSILEGKQYTGKSQLNLVMT